ncbi:hypothetical protein GCM10023088_51590 [Actinomadura verrucosospora]|uniref:NACHT domain-containing protein n=1 Tax=Actinomadura verrucosospora TaxID=46165 RepID=UPI0031E6CED0
MTGTLAAEQFAQLERSYLRSGADGVYTVHECLAASDFHLRFVTMCTAAALRNRDPDQVRLGRSPGYGAYVSYLRTALSILQIPDRSDRAGVERVVRLIESALHVVLDGSGEAGVPGLEQLRNHVFHGGAIPDGPNGEAWTVRARTAVAETSRAIMEFLSNATTVISAGEAGLDRVELQWTDSRLHLWPFVCADKLGNWCIFSNFTGRLPVYVRRGQQSVRVDGRGEKLMYALYESMVPKLEDRTLPDFIGDLRADLNGFRDRDHELHHDERGGIVNIIWVRATGTGTEERSDNFRIGYGEQREWEEESGRWIPYPDFLRAMANWPVVATRIRQQLQSLEERLLEEEQATLGWARRSSPVLIEPMIRLTDLQLSHDARPPLPFRALLEEMDERPAVRGSRTRIYFVTGEAGIGKTRALLSTALRRAKQVEAENAGTDSQDRLPLFLYVRSTGQASSSLQTVVGAAVSETRNLNEDAVRTLCRNGLITLFIDGFDELLGGLGYGDALGSLRTWIEAMGGRGVIVVSARSSYYLQQYRTSLQQTQSNRNLAVEHRVALIQRWTDSQVVQFLEQHGLGASERDALGDEDQSLLGLPFFARVFVQATQQDTPRDRPLPDLIIEQYLAREAAKLIAPGDQERPLLDAGELRIAFENLAELMADKGEREVTLDDLQFAVEMGLGSTDIESRRGLTDRLSVLCGIAVTGGSAADRRFSFQHELFYDFFLADAILQYLRRGQFEQVLGTLRRAQLRVATVARIVRLAAEQTAILIIRADEVNSASVQAEQLALLRSNIGELWMRLVQRTGRLGIPLIGNATFERLDLTEVELDSIRFVECEFGTLVLPPQGTWAMRLDRCYIETLWVKGQASLDGVKSFDGSVVSQMIYRDALLEKPSEVARELHKLGVPVPLREDAATESRLEEAASYFLDKIAQRADTVFVLKHGYQSATTNIRWPHEYGDAVWADFIRILQQSGVAELMTLPASGPQILRVKFLASVEALRDRDSSDETIAQFWELAAKRS